MNEYERMWVELQAKNELGFRMAITDSRHVYRRGEM
jgi:hypothetical protein